MPIQIRVGIFQTNSSSVHSIVLGDLKNKEDIIEVKKSISKDITIFKIPTYLVDDNDIYEFGWGYDEYTDVPTKVAYTYIWNKLRNKNKNIKLIENYIIAKLRSQGFNKLKKIKWEYKIGDGASYIDHQSLEDDSLEFLITCPEFLFNPGSKLIISNDNSCPECIENYRSIKDRIND
jgi:hypothetical protein